ncbi:MAG: hypothetical protein HQ582_15435 [Planctomycetes bacterium]|nr:hypothetical protein [Planctomycetota bacterium]
MATELTSESTHEEVQELVDKIVEDRKSEEPEEKGDAQKIAEERDEPDIAEVDSGNDDDTAPEGEETGEQDWLDDSLKAEVAAFGIDEKELADFTSREELERAMRFFDRTALEAGRKAMAEGGEGEEQTRDEQGQFVKKEPESEPKEGAYEVSLNKEVYEDDLVAEFTRMRDHYEGRVAALEARFEEADTRAEEQRFDSLVDSLGHADLFGKNGKEKPKELERRKDLFVAVKAQQLGLQQLGRPTDIDESLINRVARMVFAEELGKKDLKERTRKVSKQSNGRMGGSATKAHNAAEPLKDEMRRLYKELEDA